MGMSDVMTLAHGKQIRADDGTKLLFAEIYSEFGVCGRDHTM